MQISKRYSPILLILLFSFSLTPTLSAKNKPFTIVIDAGHGGKDVGARGKISNEKNINLTISLKLGKKIKENYPDVKVIYTRDKDIFIPLNKRAYIANKKHPDLFISIHTNSARNTSAHGTETYVLGVDRFDENLEVAMKENSVITLEDDYKTQYEGFDPNSIDSYIMFEFMQNRYLDKSLQIASLIESKFKKVGRHSRGVRQAGFLVLRKPACPSILVELGFISNRTEERYLNSKAGQKSMVNAIFTAFEIYKKEHERKNVTAQPTNRPTFKAETKNTIDKNKVTYKIQLFALEKRISPKHSEFKGLKNVDYYVENHFYKYTYGAASTFKEMEKIRKKISSKFPEAYIIAFKGDKKITIGEAIKIE